MDLIETLLDYIAKLLPRSKDLQDSFAESCSLPADQEGHREKNKKEPQAGQNAVGVTSKPQTLFCHVCYSKETEAKKKKNGSKHPAARTPSKSHH